MARKLNIPGLYFVEVKVSMDPIRNTPTRLVGVTFNGRQELLRRTKEEGIQTASLIREPKNPCDPDAVLCAVTFLDGSVGYIGHIQNSDRLCLGTLPNGQECGTLIDGNMVTRSRTCICPNCGQMFSANNSNTELRMSGEASIKWTTCSSCGTTFELSRNNAYVHTCGSYTQARAGLASALCRGIEAGCAYKCRILEVTGGEVVDGKQRTLGCNVFIEKN
jgi:hypothetical protein